MAIQSSSPERPIEPRSPPEKKSLLFSCLLGFATWLAFWALLSQARGWEFGIPLAALATYVGHRYKLRTGTLHLGVIPALLGFFLRELFIGGWDVAKRALHPRLPVAPAWHTLTLTSHSHRACLLLSAMVGLLPGTLASRYQDQTLYVHALDEHQDWQRTIIQLEALLTRLLEGKPA